MMAPGPTSTPEARVADGSTRAVGWMVGILEIMKDE